MKTFFKVTELEEVLELAGQVQPVDVETCALDQILGRVLAEPVTADTPVPPFARTTMDGYAVSAASTFGASEANPAYLEVVGKVAMGQVPTRSVGPGEAMRIATGGMLPPGTDAVAMVEHTSVLDETTIEVYRSVAPGQHVIEAGEDLAPSDIVLAAGHRMRPQDAGVLAALGLSTVKVYTRPTVGIVSTGDEIVAVDRDPAFGQIRDMNTHTLSDLVRQAGAVPRSYGIVSDQRERLMAVCRQAVVETDMLLVSGGSSVGVRDYTIEAFTSMDNTEIRVHGITISPGKPTILAFCGSKPVWGLPGHVTSAMVVFSAVVRPFLDRLCGAADKSRPPIPALLSRNLESAAGRVDFVRVRLVNHQGKTWAEPILGKSGLIRTMVQADGLIAIDMNTEGLEQGEPVAVWLF